MGHDMMHSKTYSSPAHMAFDVPVKTLYENFEHGCSRNPSSPCLGCRQRGPDGTLLREYSWLSYEAVQHERNTLGSFLIAFCNGQAGPNYPNIEVKTGFHVGIYSINRPEWVVAEQACNAYSLVSVALYDTLGKESISYILEHAEIPVVITTFDKMPNILSAASECPKLKCIICMDNLKEQENSLISVVKLWAKDKDILFLDWREVMNQGQRNLRPPIPPFSHNIASICYTSGTTGQPKGAILTHENYVSAVACLLSLKINLSPGECHISYLPLAHCFERIVQVAVLFLGAAIGFYSGNVLGLVEDIQILRPTLFISVPRLFNKIYAKMTEQTTKAPGIKGILFRKAFEAKKAHIQKGYGPNHPIWDRLLFSKVAAGLGGRVRYVICGSAPTNPFVLQFLRVVLSAQVFEGYGATESSACGSITPPDDQLNGSVGVATSGGSYRLASVPELNYKITDKPQPRGEILLKGPYIFKGYYKSPETTREAIDSDGWLYTGDIGTVDGDGRLYIIDRKKHVFKLAQGEYIAPEKLEQIYSDSPIIGQIYIEGDPLSSFIVAIVVPEYDRLKERSSSISSSLGELCKEQSAKTVVLDALTEIARERRLQKFEYIKDLYLEGEPFSLENGILTPTMKIKRHVAKKKYASQIEKMYGRQDSGHRSNGHNGNSDGDNRSSLSKL